MAQKKSGTKNRTKKRKLHTKKGKVYINPYKIVILCAAVIALCMGLLVVSTAISQKNQAELENQIKIEKQLEEDRIKEEKRLEAEKKEAERKRLEKEEAAKKLEKELKEKKLKEEKRLAEEKKAAEEKKLAEQKKLPEEKKKQKPEAKKPENKKAEKPVRTPNTETRLPASPAPTTVSPSKPAVPPANTAASPSQPAPAPASKFNFPQAKNGAQLVILLDDGGQNLAHLQKFLDLPFPLTIAVLPQLAHSRESAAKVRAVGKELMLHQPMQAVNESVNPGPGAITPNMDQQQIKATLFKNISEIGPVAGFNNHEGSLITADAEKMETVLKYASENGIYFLDSRTNVNTSVPAVASGLGLSYYERNGRFLDNVKTRENAITEIRRNLDIANRDGVVIMIGHIWSADFLPAALMEVYPELIEKGYTFRTVSECRGLKR